MGGKCSPSGGIVAVRDERNLKREGKRRTRTDLYIDGVLVQSRWYNFRGDAIWERDHIHQDAHDNHKFPHDHMWRRMWNKKKGKKENIRLKTNLPRNDKYC